MLTKKQRLDWFKEELRRIREKALYIYVAPKDRASYAREYYHAVRKHKHER